MSFPVNQAQPLAAALLLLSGCTAGGDAPPVLASAPAQNGPAADYPIVLGDPFTIDGTIYRPADTMNYDAVGFATVADGTEPRIAGAHKTLPLPSYVEVTSLDSGRTILVRLETRGPMVADTLLQLSAGAAAQLGIAPSARAPVRVRRVNPPEVERALLREGKPAPERMATPKPLLDVLLRKLEPQAPVKTAADAAPLQASSAAATAAEPTEPSASTSRTEQLIVQVAAFSTQERAQTAASVLGAQITRPDKYWLMRLGPFNSRAEAESALAKARAAGYGDARIQRAD